MAKFNATKTEANLRYAFASEILASRRYLAYAARADSEGNNEVAALFRSIADRRSSHAQKHLEMLELSDDATISNTGYNVRAAIMNEVHESADLYPGMVRKAREEGLEDIAGWLEILVKASRSHAGRFRRVLEALM